MSDLRKEQEARRVEINSNNQLVPYRAAHLMLAAVTSSLIVSPGY